MVETQDKIEQQGSIEPSESSHTSEPLEVADAKQNEDIDLEKQADNTAAHSKQQCLFLSNCYRADAKRICGCFSWLSTCPTCC